MNNLNENDPFSEYNKIPHSGNRTNDAVYFQINFSVEICSALEIFDSHLTLHSLSLILSILEIQSSIPIAIIVFEPSFS